MNLYTLEVNDFEELILNVSVEQFNQLIYHNILDK